MQLKRKAGVLMHPTSLPGPGGIGTLGDEAYAFVDFLERAGQSLWQVLPLGPVGYGNSPYSCYSAFAGNPLLIDLQTLQKEGDLESVDLEVGADDRVHYQDVAQMKMPLLSQAAHSFFEAGDSTRRDEFRHFCETSNWLHHYSLYMAFKEHFSGRAWNEWPKEISRLEPATVDELSRMLDLPIQRQKYLQWQFFRQWARLKAYANERGVQIIGDIPIFVAYDSADVWWRPGLFQLDATGKPVVVAGVPPDYFSETGQLWGNPLYDWNALAEDDYLWWVDRVKSALLLYDWIRIDHFRGFAAYWQVPASEETAINGRWVEGPADRFFETLRDAIGDPLPIIAEDLGLITPDVEELRDRFRFPGMKVLHFAFGSGADNYYLPHNYSRCCVVYTGTHDNNTTRGWFSEAGENERGHALRYLRCSEHDVVWESIRAAYASVAAYAVIPVQDLFGLGSPSRMNSPGVATGNWEWRLPSGLLNQDIAGALRDMALFYNRLFQNKSHSEA